VAEPGDMPDETASPGSGDDSLLEEQRLFYRARAPEYDEWWQRRGRYHRGRDDIMEWNRQVAIIESALTAFNATGNVLEMAGGTGWWTQPLAQIADHLTVLDASPEALALNRKRVRREDVNYQVADLFDWRPERSYDVVFFSFWLSHVPRRRFGDFWSLVRACLAPSGRVFLIDNRVDPLPHSRVRDPYVVEYRPDVHLRELSDGSRYRVVKVMYEPDELQSMLDTEGWQAGIESTRWFIYGSARPI
jgi:demethylmenaquinone methyltransferase/2-methoxy-6-polyprenyl-1,4-benzoquinol methylase